MRSGHFARCATRAADFQARSALAAPSHEAPRRISHFITAFVVLPPTSLAAFRDVSLSHYASLISLLLFHSICLCKRPHDCAAAD